MPLTWVIEGGVVESNEIKQSRQTRKCILEFALRLTIFEKVRNLDVRNSYVVFLTYIRM